MVSALVSEVLLVEGAALDVGGVVDFGENSSFGLGCRCGRCRWPVNDLSRSRSWLGLVLLDLDRLCALRNAGSNVVRAVHGYEWGPSAVAEAALDGFQQTPDLIISSWNLNTNKFVVFLDCAVSLTLGVVNVASDFLGKTVSLVAKLLVMTVDLVWVVAVGTLACVHLEVIGGPALGGVHWT